MAVAAWCADTGGALRYEPSATSTTTAANGGRSRSTPHRGGPSTTTSGPGSVTAHPVPPARQPARTCPPGGPAPGAAVGSGRGLPIGTRRGNRRPIKPRLRRRQEGQRTQTPHRCGHGGLLLAVLVTTGGVQDRDAARLLLSGPRTCFPTDARVWADGGYAGRLVDWPPPPCTSPSTSSANSPGRTHSDPCPGGRSSNEPSPGPTAAAAPSATTTATPTATLPWSRGQ
jgi:hypothetical protein